MVLPLNGLAVEPDHARDVSGLPIDPTDEVLAGTASKHLQAQHLLRSFFRGPSYHYLFGLNDARTQIDNAILNQ